MKSLLTEHRQAALQENTAPTTCSLKSAHLPKGSFS